MKSEYMQNGKQQVQKKIDNINSYTVEALKSNHLGNSKKWLYLELFRLRGWAVSETIEAGHFNEMYERECTGHASTDIENFSYSDDYK